MQRSSYNRERERDPLTLLQPVFWHAIDYSRRLLRFQLQGILQEFVLQDIEVPAVNYTGNMPLGYFSLRKQWLSPASVEYFLQ